MQYTKSPNKSRSSLRPAKSSPRLRRVYQTPSKSPPVTSVSPARPSQSPPPLPPINSKTIKIPTRHPSDFSHTSQIPILNPQNHEYIPDWLANRDDFSLFLNEMSQKSNNIDQICLQHHSSRSTAEKLSLLNWVYSVNFFNKMPKSLVKETCDYLTTKIYNSGEIIIKRGSEADCMFIIYSGTAGIFIEGRKIAIRSDKEVVGETALSSEHLRNADVVAESVVIALMLKKIHYTSKILHYKKQERYESSKLLLKTQYFTLWSRARLDNFISFLVVSNFHAGQVIYEEASEPLNFFIVQSGNVTIQKSIQITRENKWPIGLKDWKTRKIEAKCEYQVCKLKPGEMFGFEVFSGNFRETRAVALEQVTVLVLNKPDCEVLFRENEVEELLKSRPQVPSYGQMKSSVIGTLNEKQKKVNLIRDALNLNYKDWGGRETDLEKKLRKKTRCLTSIQSTEVI